MQLSPAEVSYEAWSLGISSAHDCSRVSRRALRSRPPAFHPLRVLRLFVCRLPLHRRQVAGMLNQVCLATIVSWCTYPVVYLFPFMGISGAQAVVGIQLGYCASDVISKCGVGFLIYNITITKSRALIDGALLPK